MDRRVGPYVIDGILGEGAMGVVYRGTAAGGPARAIKTVRVPDARLLEVMRREIHALARIRHPGVVAIVDHGLHEGLPWYAMELVEGVPLDAFVARSPPRERLARVVALARKMCHALAFLHGEGIVHRDLKPGNVIVRPDGWPLLLDFGLVARFGGAAGREHLELEGDVVGTAEYLAPEQAMGEGVDARADLYALGAMLYELLVGHAPLADPSPVRMIQRRLREGVPPPSAVVPGIPAVLDDVVVRLLAPDPRRRIGHADDVEMMLRAVPGVEEAHEAVALPSPAPYLYRPMMRGRDAILERLEAWLEHDGGALSVLAGDSGVGKTRLAASIAAKARMAGLEVVVSQCPSDVQRGYEPLSAIRPALRAVADACREAGPAHARRVLRDRLLALYEPAIAGVAGLPNGSSEGLSPEEATRLVMRALRRVLAAHARARPLLLVVDDLQWADPLSLRFLTELAERGDEGVRILATCRADTEREEVRVLLGHRRVEKHEVAGLDRQSLRHVAADMLAAEDPPAALLDFLELRSEGNPFFVAQYLHAAIDHGILERRDGRWSLTGGQAAGDYGRLPLPATIHELVAQRLLSLGAQARELSRVASVIGRAMDTALLQAVSGLTDGAFLGGIQELLRHRILVEPAPGTLSFQHDRIREVVASELSEPERRPMHLRVAEVMARAEGEPRWAALAHHWEQALRLDEARVCYDKAARAALAQLDGVEAERCLRAVMALTEPGSHEHVSAQLALGDKVLLDGGWIEAARRELGDACDGARRLRDAVLEGQCLQRFAYACWVGGASREAEDLYRRAIDRYQSVADARSIGAAVGNLAQLLQRSGRSSEAWDAYEAALQSCRRADDERGALGCRVNMAILMQEQGRLEESEAMLKDLLMEVERLGERRTGAIVRVILANNANERGRLGEAREAYEHVLAVAREMGDRRLDTTATMNLGILLRHGGEPARAKVLLASAREMADEAGDAHGVVIATANLAAALDDLGEAESAHALNMEALERARAIKLRRAEAHCLVQLGRSELLRGNVAEARSRLSEARPIVEALGDRLSLAELLCQSGYVALAEGHTARPMLREARRIARQLGVDRGPVADRLDALEQAIRRAPPARRRRKV